MVETIGRHGFPARGKLAARVGPRQRSWGLLLPILGLFSAGCSSYGQLNQDQREVRWDEAERASLSGDWDSAASLWNRIRLGDEQGGPRPCLETARAMVALGRQDDALNLLDNSISRYPDDAELWLLKGKILDNLGFQRAAEADLLEATRLDPHLPDAWLRLARVQMALECPSLASQSLAQAARSGEGGSDLCLLQARAARGAQDYTGAELHYSQAVRQTLAQGVPARPQSRHGALTPNNLPEQPTYCELLVEAAALYTTPDSPRPSDPVLEEALEWTEQAASLDPQFVCAHFVRAVLLERIGRLESAVESYRRAVEIDGHHLGATTNLALLYRRMGREQEACAMFERAMQLEKDASRRALLDRLRAEAQGEIASG